MKNVILLTIDTLRRDMLGSYGNKAGLTPFLDSIRKDCIMFTRAQAVGPYTQASFPGILTSSYYLDHEDHGRGKVLSAQRRIVSEHLSANGIQTAAFHSNPYISEIFGWNRGWSEFYDSMDAEVTDEVPYIRGGDINRRVGQWLSSRGAGSGSKPFFLWTHYMDIHEPYVPEPGHLDKVDSSIKLTPGEMFQLFKQVVLPRDAGEKETVELLRKLYMAKVVEVDEYVRAFFSMLESHGVLGESVVLITADHGDEFGEHGGLSHDGKMYSELVDIPLLIHGHGGGGSVCDKLVSNVDLSPTIVYLFGLPQPAEFQGRSLLPVEGYLEKGCFGEAIGKRGRQKETDKPVFYYREGDLKLIYEMEPDRWSLYDLRNDPGETRNIFAESRKAEALKGKLTPRIRRLG